MLQLPNEARRRPTTGSAEWTTPCATRTSWSSTVYRSDPDPRWRRAAILTRHKRLAEVAAAWDEVGRDTPDDVWVFDNARLEYAAAGEDEIASSA